MDNIKVPVNILIKKNHVIIVCGFCHFVMQEGNKNEMIIMHPKTCPTCHKELNWDYPNEKRSKR